MLNVLVQIVTLLNGLRLNIIAPAIYGLHAYGEFIALNAIVFLVHKSVTIATEPLIRFTTPQHLVFVSLAINSTVFLVVYLAMHVVPLGSPLLLAAILANASVLLTLLALRLRVAYVMVQLATVGLFLGLIYWPSVGERISLTRLMEVSTIVPTVGGLAMLLMHHVAFPKSREFVTAWRAIALRMPQLLSITAVMNLFTNALPVFLAHILIPRELGLFRVATSIIQSAVFIFPLNTQALLSAFVRREGQSRDYQQLGAFSVLYFSGVGIALLILGMIIPSLAPFMLLAGSLPIYFQAILAERYLTATHRTRALVMINLAVCAGAGLDLLLVANAAQALMLYAAGMAAYATLLTWRVDGSSVLRCPAWLLGLISPLAVYLTLQHVGFGVVYLLAVGCLVWQHSRLRVHDMRVLLKEV